VLVRFGAERQALARMDHPNVAKVHEYTSPEQAELNNTDIDTRSDVRATSLGRRAGPGLPAVGGIPAAEARSADHRPGPTPPTSSTSTTSSTPTSAGSALTV
jgi:hypothetical protein